MAISKLLIGAFLAMIGGFCTYIATEMPTDLPTGDSTPIMPPILEEQADKDILIAMPESTPYMWES